MYDERPAQTILVGTLAAEDLSATGLVGYSQLLLENCSVSRLYAKVTTSVVSSAPAVFTFYARPTYGSSGSQVTLGTVAIPGGSAANLLFYKDINPINVPANYQLVADVSTAATASGAALVGLLQQYDPEVVGNMSMTASA